MVSLFGQTAVALVHLSFAIRFCKRTSRLRGVFLKRNGINILRRLQLQPQRCGKLFSWPRPCICPKGMQLRRP